MGQTSIEPRVRPFHCGSQGADWEFHNCGNCHRQGDCEIEEAYIAAYFGDGSVSLPMAARMGTFPGDLRYGWQCAEQVQAESQADYEKRHAAPATRLRPLWRRAWLTASFTWRLWCPWWKLPQGEDVDPRDCIPLRLALSVAWGIHHDDQERMPEPRP